MQSILPAMARSSLRRLLSTGFLLLFYGICLRATATDEVTIKGGPQRVDLVELYTSEGCSSCPPAEEWFSGLRHDSRLWHAFVPVAFHVDYWDRLSWKDRFAQPSFTARQLAYARAGAVSSVYTPGFFVDGREWSEWFNNRQLPLKSDRPGVLEARVASTGEVSVRFAPEIKFEGGSAHVAWLGFGLVSNVRRGENAGRTLHQDFVVLSHASANLSHDAKGGWTAEVAAPRLGEKAGALAVWIEPKNGVPVQAAGGWLKAPAQ
jgi:hypothetical protein